MMNDLEMNELISSVIYDSDNISPVVNIKDGTVIQSTYGVMIFKVKALFSDENYWVDRCGNIRSNIEVAQCIRDQFKSRDNLYVAVSPDVIKKIS